MISHGKPKPHWVPCKFMHVLAMCTIEHIYITRVCNFNRHMLVFDFDFDCLVKQNVGSTLQANVNFALFIRFVFSLCTDREREREWSIRHITGKRMHIDRRVLHCNKKMCEVINVCKALNMWLSTFKAYGVF